MKHIIAVFWIATWTAHWNTPGACKNPVVMNDYTGEPEPLQFQTAQICYEAHEKKMFRRFEKKGEAEDFLSLCDKPEYGIRTFYDPHCTDMMVEEVNE